MVVSARRAGGECFDSVGQQMLGTAREAKAVLGEGEVWWRLMGPSVMRTTQ